MTASNKPHHHDPRVEFFDRLAHQWDTTEQSQDDILPVVERWIEKLRLQPGENLLEVGCGTGQLTGWLAERVQPGRVVAIDFSQAMLDVAATKGISATFRQADVCHDDLGHADFEVALCFQSFPHFRDQAGALCNLSHCLKPGGRLIVLHQNSRHEVNAFHHGVGGSVGTDFLPDDHHWKIWLAAAGFRVPTIEDSQDGFFLEAILGDV